MEKFGGVGLVNIVIIWLVCMVLTLIARTLVVKYNVPVGLRDVVLAA